MAPQPPYLLLGFDVDPVDPDAAAIIADVLAGFPNDVIPNNLAVANTYFVQVPSSQAKARFMEVAMYLAAQDQNHNGMLRWWTQLCRIDDFANG
jgi:hypothetical protein